MPGTRLAALAGLMVAGELAGFASARVASAWPWVAGGSIMLMIAAWGWNVRHFMPVLVFFFGMVAAMRIEARRIDVLERHWRSGRCGKEPVLELPVESDVRMCHTAKGDEHAYFLSHLGPVPLKVVLRSSCCGVRSIPAPGEVWRCAGRVSSGTFQPGLFTRCVFWGKRDGFAERVAESSRSFRRLEALVEACARRAAIGLEWCPELASINRAILLGDRNGLPPAKRKIFAQAGTAHVFAISGLHVMLIAVLLVRLLALLAMPVRLRGLVAVPVLAAYVLVTGMRPSAVRAAVMAGMCLTAPAFGRKCDSLAAWALTALCVYGYSPERLFDTGCTLSFVVMFGIVAWLRWVKPILPERGKEGLCGECGVSFAAWVAGTPVVAHFFGCFTPGGLLANLVVLRLAAYLVAFGVTGMACGFVLEPAAALFNNLAAVMAFLMSLASMAVVAMPCASLPVAPWSWWICSLWYGGWIAVLALLLVLSQRRNGVWWCA